MDPALSVSMIVLAACFALAAIAPAPRKAPRGERVAYPVLMTAGIVTYAAAALMPFVDMWAAAAASSMLATAMILFCIYLARSPISRERHGGENHDEGSGGGGGPKVPDPPEPPRRPCPDGPELDWSTFDDARAGWEEPVRDREPAGV